ncbi:MAG: S9 family peptidase, partial [Planctomycetota bacterium]
MLPFGTATRWHRRFTVAWMGTLLVGCSAAPWRVGVRGRSQPAPLRNVKFLRTYAETRRFSLGRPRAIRVTPDGTAVLFLRSGPRSFVQSLYEFDTETGTERKLFSAEDILAGAAESLTEEEKARRERMRMAARGVAVYRLSRDGKRILVPLSGRLFVVERETGTVRELPCSEGYPIDPRFSPDGRFVAYVLAGDLYVMEIDTGKETRLTHRKSKHITNGLSEFVAQEEMGRFAGYWWSPDSRRLAYQQTDTRRVETLYIMDAMHPEKSPSPRPYPRPGKNNADVRLGILSVDGGETTWVTWDRDRYPYLATVKWKENAPLTILVQNREQTEEALLRVDPQTGYTAVLLVERDPAWINLDQSMPHWFPDGSAFLWMTERNGAWQLELRSADGRLQAPITSTDFRLKRFLSYDHTNGVVYLVGGDDPTQSQLFRAGVDPPSERPVPITTEPGLHSAVFARDHSVYVHSASLLDGRQFQIVRRIDGVEIGRLRSVAEKPPFLPNLELTTVGTDPVFHAAVVRPRSFHRGRRYPVIVSVYGGPHAQTVIASRRRYLLQQWIADQGFIVVSLDGRGTPARGRAWERAIKGNLIAVPLEDQVAGLLALGERYPEMDLDRVGIYGWSFGGYFSAHAVMQRPDVYHAGVAGAPVCDWRDYDTHYTERYMGLPEKNREGYD